MNKSPKNQQSTRYINAVIHHQVKMKDGGDTETFNNSGKIMLELRLIQEMRRRQCVVQTGFNKVKMNILILANCFRLRCKHLEEIEEVHKGHVLELLLIVGNLAR